ncbi:arylsulfatase A [Lentisphaera araneosa HTCC2155]|uniref:Arylsulfatase A n=1 Tax=Lentisphaera araneosa HTCC2155 TaxID=313628 RepID=A6DS99_9BACT|nr:sulfatase [Lentisphaera araneosa]EDM25444.1 arylsulfatase A [Lentisphaera araneosa HTCC2155]
MAKLLSLCIFFFSLSAFADKPNVVLIFADDQGYGDLSCFGSETIKTPYIDQMAKEGRKFTSFMVASPVCTPSRAALLTGSYPKRVGLHKGVLFPQSTTGLNPAEYTIGDHFKSLGYATACYGKWHLGHHPETLPISNGFDEYYGIPYSNDMNHPDNKNKPKGGPGGMDLLWNDPESTLTKWQTPLMEGAKIVEIPVDQRTVTRRYTDKAISFIERNKEKSFFIYLPHSMPHIPLYVPDEIRDPDPKNAYINVIEHMDDQVGRITKKLKELGLDKNTIVIYTTDNGPWLPFKHHGGSAGELRDGKGSTFEGGQRVPCVMWAPGLIPAGTETNELMTTIDLLPSLAALSSSTLPGKNKIDGIDQSALITGKAERSARNEFIYYSRSGDLEGLRQGKWKLLVKGPKKSKKSKKSNKEAKVTIYLFDLEADVAEQNNLADQNPELVAKLKTRMQELDAEITANARPVWVKK